MSAKAYSVSVEIDAEALASAKVYDDYVEVDQAVAPIAQVYQDYVELNANNPTSAKNYHQYVELLTKTKYTVAVDGVGAYGIVGGLPMEAAKVGLRWSDDGGHTWSNYYERSLGAAGEYGTRVIWRRLGMTVKLRDRVYELSGTDPTKIIIMGAELHIHPTNG